MAGPVTAVAAGAFTSCNEERRPARPEGRMPVTNAMNDTPNDPPSSASTKHGLPELMAERRAKAARLKDADAESFPYAYEGVDPIADVLGAYEHLAAGEETEERHRVAGRLAARRGSGGAAFLDLVDRTGKLQLHARRDVLGDRAFDRLTSLDIGDLLGVDGAALRSKRGEISLRVDAFAVLAKALRPPPDARRRPARPRSARRPRRNRGTTRRRLPSGAPPSRGARPSARGGRVWTTRGVALDRSGCRSSRV